MNRLLLVPCVASCLAFVFLAGSSSLEKGGASVMSSVSAVAANADASVLMSAEQIQNDLLARWNRYNESKYGFSRVYRPQRYQTPSILVNDTLPTPEGSFVGVFTLRDLGRGLPQFIDEQGDVKQDELRKLEYPFVVDRRTGDALIFSAGQWAEFSQWAVSNK